MSTLSRVLDWFPRDMSLPDEEFRSRHRTMIVLLLLHLPILALYGLSQGADLVPLGLELAPMLVLLGVSVLGALPRIGRAFAAATGLMYASLVLLHLSGGAPEAAMHFLMILAFSFLYRVWSLFAWTLFVMATSYLALDLASPLFGATGIPVVRPQMALGAIVAAGSLASIGLVLAWKSAEESRTAAVDSAEAMRVQQEATTRQDAYGRMYVNLARRSQSLVDRQLTVIDQLEEDVRDPDILAGVFELDHLTSRIRRHGESLLVVADVDLPARSSGPSLLGDVVRGAQSEIEQYKRVDARIDASIAVTGPVTRDLLHLVSELLDNATTYSPPNTTVQVNARAGDAGSVVLTVEDRGLGLEADRLAKANEDLTDTDELDENSIRHLGFRVIARLAAKHGIAVRLTSNSGGGLTAWVQVPAACVAAADLDSLAPAQLPDAPGAAPVPTSFIDATSLDEGADTDQDEDAGDDDARADEPSVPAGPAPAAPAPMPAAFSAKGGPKRRGTNGKRRSLRSVSQPQELPAPGAQDEPYVEPEPEPAAPAATTTSDLAAQIAAEMDTVGATPNGDAATAPAASTSPTPVGNGSNGSNDSAPPLPKRQRGASGARAKEEALDLFGELDAGLEDRSSLGDFQRAQASARQENHS